MHVFPHGLMQASCPSSVDALLLAGFALHCVPDCAPAPVPAPVPAPAPDRAPRTHSFVELGAGSGMASLALALALPEVRGVGVEVDAASHAAAEANAVHLQLFPRLSFVHSCVENKAALRAACGEKHPLVLANPPYHRGGRPSPSSARQKALHEETDTLSIFCAAAFALLAHHGRFCCIVSAARLPHVLEHMHRHRLGVRRLLPVYTRKGRDAQWALVEARKDAAADMRFLPALVLHAGAEGREYSAEALSFCPWLQSRRHTVGGFEAVDKVSSPANYE